MPLVGFLRAVEESERTGQRCPFYLGKVSLRAEQPELNEDRPCMTFHRPSTDLPRPAIRCRCAQSCPSSTRTCSAWRRPPPRISSATLVSAHSTKRACNDPAVPSDEPLNTFHDLP